MNKLLNRVIAGLLSLLLVGLAVLPARFHLVAPRLGRPAVVLAGASIDLQIKTSLPFWSPDWRVQLLADDHLTDLPVKNQTTGMLTHIVRVSLPSDLRQGRYSLRIKAGEDSEDFDSSVYVRREFARQTRFIQLADLPTLGVAGDDGDTRFAQIIDEINLINPDFVLFTGDVAYVGGWEQYRRLVAALKTIDAPVIVAPGNHEYQGWGAYLQSFGLPVHAVDVGAYRIFNLNSGHARDQITASQLQWLADNLAVVQQDGKIPLVQIHHPIQHRPELHGYVQGNAQALVDLFSRYKVPIVLSGHWHGDAVYDAQGKEYADNWQFQGTVYTVVTAAGADLRPKYSSSPVHHGYRLLRMDGERLLDFTYDYDGDGRRDAASSIPMNKLHAYTLAPEHQQISNELNESFTAALLHFTLPGKDLQRRPSQGSLQASYFAHDQSHYEVVVDVAAHSVQDVFLEKPSGE